MASCQSLDEIKRKRSTFTYAALCCMGLFQNDSRYRKFTRSKKPLYHNGVRSKVNIFPTLVKFLTMGVLWECFCLFFIYILSRVQVSGEILYCGIPLLVKVAAFLS